MKRLFHFWLLLVVVAALALFAGCQKYDDSRVWAEFGKVYDRIEELERLCDEMNGEISSLQSLLTAMQSNDFITSVTPVTSADGKSIIGYTIAFAKSQPITIYHGEDGSNGADGYTPRIGVETSSDGLYYWTLDGEWLLDGNGNMVPAQGAKGADGENGEDGADGENGITPRLKIESDYWYVSYDGGLSWTLLGKATGADGADGSDGNNGSDGGNGSDGSTGYIGGSLFEQIDTSNSEYVLFRLANGVEVKIPTWYAFEQLRTLCNQLNTNLLSLQQIVNALQDRDYATSCTPLMENGRQVGWTITFAKGGAINLYNGEQGASGSVPEINIRLDETDYLYYWTLNGEWMTDQFGNKVPAQGVTPYIKIEDGYWYGSMDYGKTWHQLGSATCDCDPNGGGSGDGSGEGGEGDDDNGGGGIIQDATQDEENIYIQLPDDVVITIPKQVQLSLSLSTESIVPEPNKTYYVTYEINSSSDSGAFIELFPSPNVTAEIDGKNTDKSGMIILKTGESVVAGVDKVLIFASNGEKVVMKSICFEVAGLEIYEDTTKFVEAAGGEVELEFLTNVSCEVVIPSEAQSWLSTTPPTRALNHRSESVYASANEGDVREATVRVQSVDNAEMYVEYTIVQHGGEPVIAIDTPSSNCEIWYTSTIGKKIDFKFSEGAFRSHKEDVPGVGFTEGFCTLLSNTYTNGKGVLRFDKEVLHIYASYNYDTGSYADAGFNGVPLESVSLPSSVKTINQSVFYRSSLRNLILADGVENIGDCCAMESPNLEIVTIPAGCKVGGSAFADCPKLRDVKIGENVHLGSYAFANCNSLTHVYFPKGCKLEECVFRACARLYYVQLPEGLEQIPEECFAYCRKLNRISIPNGVKQICVKAFYECTNLWSLQLPASMEIIEQYAFCDCYSLGIIGWNGALKEIGEFAFKNCRSLTKFDPPYGGALQVIDKGAFLGTSLYSAYIPELVTKLNPDSFRIETLRRVYMYPTLPPGKYWYNAFMPCKHDPGVADGIDHRINCNLTIILMDANSDKEDFATGYVEDDERIIKG